MADKRINALATTASSTASDDFIAVDGTTNGTRKLNAFSPTFGGNATVTGTLTANSTFTAANGTSTSPSICFASATTSGFARVNTNSIGIVNNGIASGYIDGITASGGLFIAASGTNQNISLNASGTGLITSANPVTFTNTTASTTTSTGALVVSGGVGIAGSLNVGSLNSLNIVTGGDTGSGTSILLLKDGLGANKVNFQGNGQVQFLNTTASTSTSSGALVVSGGVGVAKELYVGAGLDVVASGSTVASFARSATSPANAGWSIGADNDGGYISTLQIAKFRIFTGGTTALTIDSSQKTTFAATIKTAAPAGGTAAEWKLGTVATVSPTSPNRTIEVDIGGTIYYIHAKTTNN